MVPERKKGAGSICRNGPEGAAHKWCLTPFFDYSHSIVAGGLLLMS
jgi:hypothetical protein